MSISADTGEPTPNELVGIITKERYRGGDSDASRIGAGLRARGTLSLHVVTFYLTADYAGLKITLSP